MIQHTMPRLQQAIEKFRQIAPPDQAGIPNALAFCDDYVATGSLSNGCHHYEFNHDPRAYKAVVEDMPPRPEEFGPNAPQTGRNQCFGEGTAEDGWQVDAIWGSPGEPKPGDPPPDKLSFVRMHSAQGGLVDVVDFNFADDGNVKVAVSWSADANRPNTGALEEWTIAEHNQRVKDGVEK